MKNLLPFSVFLLFAHEQIEGGLYDPAPMLGIVDAFQWKAKHECTEIRSLVGDTCSIVARCVDKGGISTSGRKQAIRCRYGITLFIYLGREGKRGVGSKYLACSDSPHASAMSELQGVLRQLRWENATQVRT